MTLQPMNIQPIVKYFLLAEDYALDEENPLFFNLFHILSGIHSVDSPPFPILVDQIFCVVGLTDGRGKGIAQVVCLEEETGLPLFGSQQHEVDLGFTPLEVKVVGFRILDCQFPRPGTYSFEFSWNGQTLIAYTMRVR